MPKIIFKTIIFCVVMFTFSIFANAQSDNKLQPNAIVVGVKKTAQVFGKGAVTVVGESAKITWKATKFAASEVVEPTAKVIVVKATPKITTFIVKQTGIAIKRATPIATKLLLTYLKL